MICQITKQCTYCSSHIYVQNKKEVKDEIIDGRRVLSVKCSVCDSYVEIIRKREIPEEVRKFKVE